MGTEVELAVSHTAVTAEQSSDEVRALLMETENLVIRLEQNLSRFIEHNELYQLNHSEGQWLRISDELAAVLRLAESAYRRSEGLFNPFMGTAMVKLGYEKSFHLMDKAYRAADTKSERTYMRPRGQLPLAWSECAANTVKLFPDCQVDLGGIAKGWIVEQAARLLWNRGMKNFVVDAGGDMVCSGTNQGTPWPIGIANPVLPEKTLVLDVESASIATSGTYRRKWKVNGEGVHHILDPRTSWSAQTDIVSSSVFHASLTEAEWMTKTVLLQGSKQGIDWLRKQDHRGWVVVLDNGEVKHAWM